MKETVEGWSALECLTSRDDTPGSILFTTETHNRTEEGKLETKLCSGQEKVMDEGKVWSRQRNDMCTGI